MHNLTPLAVSISNREIADLTGKRPDNVARDICNMSAALYKLKDDPDWDYEQLQSVSFEFDNRGNMTLTRLDKDHTLTLTASYNVKTRMKIIKRWLDMTK